MGQGCRSGVRLMSPGQARAALFGCLIVMVGVGVNALLLQARSPAASEAVIERALPRPGRDQARKAAELAQADRTGSIRGRDDLVGERALRIARFAPASAKLDALPEEQTDL